jgi:hypothetical protein
MDASIIPADLFTGLNIAVLVMMSAIAFALKGAGTISDATRVLALLGMGACWGVANTFMISVPETPVRSMVALVIQAILMNAGGAYLLSFGARVAMEKLGMIKSDAEKAGEHRRDRE